MGSGQAEHERINERRSYERKDADRERSERKREEFTRRESERDRDRQRETRPSGVERSGREADRSRRRHSPPSRRRSAERHRDSRAAGRDREWLRLRNRDRDDPGRQHDREHFSRHEQRRQPAEGRTDSPLSERNGQASRAQAERPSGKPPAPSETLKREADAVAGGDRARSGQQVERGQHSHRHAAGEAQQPAAVPELDFFSERFDPSRALHTPGLQPPNPAVRPLQMLQQCRFILPPELDESLAEANFQPKSQEQAEAAKARVGPAAKRRQAAELKHSVVDRIAATITKGPLLLLKRCFELGSRVRVVTRHARGARGTAEAVEPAGALMAFDKFMNLVLADVEETYTVRVRIERVKTQLRLKPSCSEQTEPSCSKPVAEGVPGQAEADMQDAGGYELVDRSRTAFKQEPRSRKLKQIFVRGSNIVLISAAQPQLPGAPSRSAAA